MSWPSKFNAVLLSAVVSCRLSAKSLRPSSIPSTSSTEDLYNHNHRSASDQMWNIATISCSVPELWCWTRARSVAEHDVTVKSSFDLLDIKKIFLSSCHNLSMKSWQMLRHLLLDHSNFSPLSWLVYGVCVCVNCIMKWNNWFPLGD